MNQTEFVRLLDKMIENYRTDLGWCTGVQFIAHDGSDAPFITTSLYAGDQLFEKVAQADMYGAIRIAIRELDFDISTSINWFFIIFEHTFGSVGLVDYNDQSTSKEKVINSLIKIRDNSHYIDIVQVMES